MNKSKMRFSNQSLFKLELNETGIKISRNKSEVEAEITRIKKMKSATQVSKGTTYLSWEFLRSEIIDGIYRVYFEYKIPLSDKKTENHYYLTIKNGKALSQTSKYPKKLSGKIKRFDDKFYRINNILIDKSDWGKILDFYIIENPSVAPNKNYITAKYFDIKKSWGNNCWQKGDTLKTILINTIPNYFSNVISINSISDMKKSIKKLGLEDFNNLPKETRICIYDSCSNIFLSIFRHIRNGLAHGRFKIFEDNGIDYLFIEDVSRGNVSARMMLEVSIIIKWIHIIKKI